MKPRIYIAAPLFSAAEKMFNSELKTALSPHFQVFLPQEDGMLMVELIARGVTASDASKCVFKGDIQAIAAVDAVVAVLDGRSIDEGAAFELGYAFAIGKTCVALQTDTRRLASFGNNPMIDGCLSLTFATVRDLTEWAMDFCRLKGSPVELPTLASRSS